eukprot:1161439-Pelagomonas_calceolata.AAC.9
MSTRRECRKQFSKKRKKGKWKKKKDKQLVEWQAAAAAVACLPLAAGVPCIMEDGHCGHLHSAVFSLPVLCQCNC